MELFNFMIFREIMLMRVLIFCLFVISISGCKTNHPWDFVLPNAQECHNIISEIIDQDTFILGNVHCLTLIDDLVPMKIRLIPFIEGELPPIDLDDFHTSFDYFGEIGMLDSTNIQRDSLYFVYQNDSTKSFKLNLLNKERFEFSPLETNCISQKVQFSVPILNFSKNRAFVRVKIGPEIKLTYILIKIGQKWQIADTKVEYLIRCGFG